MWSAWYVGVGGGRAGEREEKGIGRGGARRGGGLGMGWVVGHSVNGMRGKQKQ